MRWDTFEQFIGGLFELDDPVLAHLVHSVVERLPEHTDFPVFDVVECHQRVVPAAVYPGPRLELDAAKLTSYSFDVARGVIAHELAHIQLRHDPEFAEDLRQEREADKRASRWGFPREVGAMRTLLGPATNEPSRQA